MLIGLAVAGMLSDNKKSKSPEFVQTRDLVNNNQAFLAAERFIANLRGVTDHMAQNLINAVLAQVIEPLEQQIKRQRDVLEQIKSDLKRTEDGQRELRGEIGGRLTQIAGLRDKWVKSFGEMLG